MKYLIDTCVISELMKRNPNEQLLCWIKEIPEESLYISVLTLGEICKGISKLSDKNKQSILQQWLDNDLMNRFHGRIIHIDKDIAMKWGEISGFSEQKGRKLPVVDSLLAATSIENDCILVTRNESDFKTIRINLFNPWKID